MRKTTILGTFALGFFLTACNPPAVLIPNVAISSNQVVAAASAFDALEVAATAYISLPRCPSANLCRDPVATTKIIIAVRTARHARDNLEKATNSGASSVSALQALTIANATLTNIMVQYGIAGV